MVASPPTTPPAMAPTGVFDLEGCGVAVAEAPTDDAEAPGDVGRCEVELGDAEDEDGAT